MACRFHRPIDDRCTLVVDVEAGCERQDAGEPVEETSCGLVRQKADRFANLIYTQSDLERSRLRALTAAEQADLWLRRRNL